MLTPFNCSARTGRVCLALVALALFESCSGIVIRGFGTEKPTPNLVDNPLSGQVISATVDPASPDLDSMKADDCSFWPLTDRYQVQVVEDRLCVQIERGILSYESGPFPVDSLSVGFSIDSAPARFFDVMASRPMRKIGHCYGSSTPGFSGVWVAEFSGCTPNDGQLKPSSKTLSVRMMKGGLFADKAGVERAVFEFIDRGALAAAMADLQAEKSAKGPAPSPKQLPAAVASSPPSTPRVAASRPAQPPAARAQTILRTRDGRTLTGRVLSESSNGYLFRTEATTELIPYSNIDDLVRPEAPAASTAAPAGTATEAPVVSEAPEVDWRGDRKGLHPSIGLGAGVGYSSNSAGFTLTALPALAYGFGWVDLNATAAVSAGRLLGVTAELQTRINFTPRYSFGAGVFAGVLVRSNPELDFGLSVSPAIIKLGQRGEHQLAGWIGAGARSGLEYRASYSFAF